MLTGACLSSQFPVHDRSRERRGTRDGGRDLDHLPDPVEAGTLSALMQGGGFVIAAPAPWIVAALHDGTGGFVAGWLLHLGCAAAVAMLIARLAPSRYARAMMASPGPIRPHLQGSLPPDASDNRSRVRC